MPGTRVTALAGIAILLVMAFGAGCSSRNALMIDHVTIVDGNGGVIRDGAIVIEEGRIRDAGPRQTITPSGTVIDATGKWAIPGLIDSHMHLDQSGGLYTRPDIFDARRKRPYDDEVKWLRGRVPITLRRYLASGVTSVVDLGGPMWTFDARDQANADLNAPRLAVTGPLIATHPSPELDGSDPPVVVTTSASQSRELVRRVLERRPDLVKILWVYVAGDDDIATQSEIVRAAIEESHARGARAAVHALELQTAKAALRAGADILVHSVEDQPVDAELIELLKARDTIYIPTLAVMEGYYKVFGQDGGPIPMTDIERRFGDPLVIQSWSELLSISLEDVARSPHLPPREERPVMFDNLRVVASNGIRIAVGTDAGNIGTLHGPSIHREMELMAQAGLRPAEILAAATKNAAAVMGRAMELGTIEKGKLADIVILNADPLVDVKHLRDIFRVIKGGAFVEIDENALKEK